MSADNLAPTGYDCKLYYNSGSYQTPTLVEINQIEDLNVSELQWTMAELKRRKRRWKVSRPASLSAAVEFKLWHKLDPAVFDFLRGAFFSGTPVDFWILNGPSDTDGTEGLRMHCTIAQFPWNQALEEISGHDVRLDPAYYYDSVEADEIDPEWVVITVP